MSGSNTKMPDVPTVISVLAAAALIRLSIPAARLSKLRSMADKETKESVSEI